MLYGTGKKKKKKRNGLHSLLLRGLRPTCILNWLPTNTAQSRVETCCATIGIYTRRDEQKTLVFFARTFFLAYTQEYNIMVHKSVRPPFFLNSNVFGRGRAIHVVARLNISSCAPLFFFFFDVYTTTETTRCTVAPHPKNVPRVGAGLRTGFATCDFVRFVSIHVGARQPV